MTSRDHKHEHARSKGLHKDWRVWVAVIVMFAAILTYVLTLDDSIIPR